MNLKNKPAVRRPLIAMYLGMAIVLVACGSVTPVPAQTGSLRLDDGAIEARNKNNDWVPVGGETTFELIGELQSTNPWMVTGNTFAVRDSTQIAEGLETGNWVKVKGIIVKDGTWLASSIEPAEEQVDPSIILTGKVDSVDPWVINGIKFNVTDDTTLTGKIIPGMIVDVDILLLEDGTWDVLSIVPLSNFTEIPGCATVTATVLDVTGDKVQFAGWPAITLNEGVRIQNETGQETSLRMGRVVLVVVCKIENGQFTITEIIVLKAGADGTSANGEKVLICHKPDKKGGHTLSIAAPSVPAHLAHGDKPGPCP